MRGLKFFRLHQLNHFLTSHSIWVRGLKYATETPFSRPREVALYMGAWIEIYRFARFAISGNRVALYMGAWIEMYNPRTK